MNSARHGKRTERLQVMLDDRELEILDEWRFKYRMPSRAAAIRFLIRQGLELTDTEALQDVRPATLRSGDFGIAENPFERFTKTKA